MLLNRYFVQFVELGRVTSIEVNHKNVDKATTGQEVCIKIENMGGDAPKMYGRHFDHTDMLVSKVIYSLVRSFNFDSLLTLQRKIHVFLLCG